MSEFSEELILKAKAIESLLIEKEILRVIEHRVFCMVTWTMAFYKKCFFIRKPSRYF